MRADLVVIGAGAIGGWASYFAAGELGASRVVVLEAGLAGQGASSRAAGIVRAQGGTPTAVRLGLWSIDFYRRQASSLGTDSGFRELGYLLLARDEAEEREAHVRIAMQREAGLDVRWVDADEARSLSPALVGTGFVGASYAAGDGAIDPPRNVRAYSLAMQRAGVELRERTRCDELIVEDVRVVGVVAAGERIVCDRVLITGGPSLRAAGATLGLSIPVGGARHQVAITEPHPEAGAEQAMGFDVGAGLYWREEEGGLLFGMSDPDERAGEARAINWEYMERMRARLAETIPATDGLALRKAWAATIDYTPDHLPIIGPALDSSRAPIAGTTVAGGGGHGMMWGPAVARAAAELALNGGTDVVDVTDLGLDRFDERGRSRLAADAIALPFPEDVAVSDSDRV
jgi:glycine/D-amino acid oxidase-like deaminating enzyme